MRFTMIRFDGDTVGFRWENKVDGALDKHEWTCDEPPTPAFKAALASFAPFVIRLIEAPGTWSEDLEVRQLTLKEEDKGGRGIVITALHKCERAKNRTLLLNTPYMAEAPDGYNGTSDGYLDAETLELIEALEEEADAYRGGERGEQTKLALGDSENSKAFGERVAASGVASTRKPKGKGKKKDPTQMPGVGLVANPDATEVLDDEALRQLLLSVERDVPIDALGRFTSSERSLATRWAMMRQRELIDALKPDERMPSEPPCLLASATPSLLETAR